MKVLKLEQLQERPVSYKQGWCLEDGVKTGVIHAKRGLPDIENGRKEQSWEGELEELCVDTSKNHFLDISERKQVARLLKKHMAKRKKNLICDFGASSGYMIADLARNYMQNKFIACDLYEEGLRRSYRNLPDIMHIQMNLKEIPFYDSKIDAAVCLNVLEHIGDDRQAVREIYRVMKKGGIVCFVVPYGKKLYDYYDESIYHKRRYGKKELAAKVQEAGFQIIYENYIGASVYLPFALKKCWNQMRGRHMSKEEKRKAFEEDGRATKDSRIGYLLMGIEELTAEKVQFPFGIRNLVLAQK